MIIIILLIFGFFQIGLVENLTSIQRISSGRGIINESPIWDHEVQALYWLDIRGQTIHKYDGKSVKSVTVTEGGMISGIVPVANNPGYFIIGIGTQIKLLQWRNGKNIFLESYSSLDVDKPENRVNDAKCDSMGRYWIGTMGKQNYTDGSVMPLQGSLYMVESKNHKHPKAKISPVSISNGMTWSKDNTKYFYIDSSTRKIDVYNFNFITGEIGNKSTLFDFDLYGIPGIPDGMTIDENDNLWVAVYGGGMVIQVNSANGELLNRHQMPTEQVSSVIWGGKNLDILYVTTGSQYMTDEELKEDADAGHVFELTGLGVKGLKSHKYDIGVKL